MTGENDNAYQLGLIKGERLKSAQAEQLHDRVRGLAASLGEPEEHVRQRVIAFDRARLDAVPSTTTYPELRGYRDRIDAEDRGKRDAGATDALIALDRSLNFYCQTWLLVETGKAYRPMPLREKCRILYVPQAEGGPIHAKNVDDPITYYKPQPPTPAGTPWPWTHPLVFDGVGSGLHIDEIPPDIFPVDARELCQAHCTTLDAAREFLVRYNHFWRDQNLLVHDHHGNSLAFDKTACRVATHGPDERGVNWITGMGARDPEIAAFQNAMRQKYLDQIGQDWDGPNGRFWRICDGKFRNMARYVAELPDSPTPDDIHELMSQRDPDGPMCLTGTPCHPDDTAPGWTLQMRMFLMDRKEMHLRQVRDGKPAYLDDPEVIRYA